MVNFDEIIALAMKEGKSIEDIAKEMSEALNEASKPKITPRDAYIAELQDQVEAAIVDEEFDPSDSIAALTLCVIENHDNWSLESIQTFVKSIEETVRTTEKMIDCVENNDNIFEALASALGEALGSKSKGKEEGGRPCKRSDDEALKRFLKSQGI